MISKHTLQYFGVEPMTASSIMNKLRTVGITNTVQRTINITRGGKQMTMLVFVMEAEPKSAKAEALHMLNRAPTHKSINPSLWNQLIEVCDKLEEANG